MKKPKKLTIAEVILNRYLKEYNEEMVEGLFEGFDCPISFGYTSECDGSCKQHFENNPLSFREIDRFNGKSLKGLCYRYGVEFKPTDEFERKAEEQGWSY